MVAGASLRVVFFGTPEFAVPTLEHLLASRHQVVAAVTQPDRPRGRGQQVSAGPVKAAALSAHVPVFQPPTLKDGVFLPDVSAMHADIGVVAAYGKILPESLINTPRLGMINVHASLLPRHRGAAPIHRAVIAGDEITGVTIMRVVKALDAGAMLATVERRIGINDTSEEVERDLAQLGAALLVKTLDRMADGAVEEIPQDDSLSTYAVRLTKDDGVMHWERSALELHNQIRGLYPWPHAFSYLDGRRVILWRSTVITGTASAAPGTVTHVGADGIDVATGNGTLRITALQAEGKRPLEAREFAAGHRLAAGSRFVGAP